MIEVCSINQILINSGVCALVGGEQVAIFRVLEGQEEKLFALSNFDPFSEANVISRGLIGSLEDKTVVASPIYKQHFCLASGQCLEDESVRLKTYQVNLDGEKVLVAEEASVAA